MRYFHTGSFAADANQPATTLRRVSKEEGLGHKQKITGNWGQPGGPELSVSQGAPSRPRLSYSAPPGGGASAQGFLPPFLPGWQSPHLPEGEETSAGDEALENLGLCFLWFKLKNKKE